MKYYYIKNLKYLLDIPCINISNTENISEINNFKFDYSKYELFTNNFSGDSLEYNADLNVLYMGENQERRVFSLILHNSRDLVVEYYDLLNYQLRKFIFTRS